LTLIYTRHKIELSCFDSGFLLVFFDTVQDIKNKSAKNKPVNLKGDKMLKDLLDSKESLSTHEHYNALNGGRAVLLGLAKMISTTNGLTVDEISNQVWSAINEIDQALFLNTDEFLAKIKKERGE